MKSFTIRIDEKSLHKLHYIAGFEGRSDNSQVLQLIKEAVEAYEKEHGPIPIDWKRGAKK